MLSSKSSRSGALDFGAKNNNSSIFLRKLSSSRICRGDPLINRDALVSIERRPSAKIVSSSQNQIGRVSTMQRQMGRLEEEELQSTKDQLDAAGADRDRALDELAESKMVANEANIRLNEALSPRRAGKVFAELTTVKESLSKSEKELAVKEKDIESMKIELQQAKQLENKLAEKELSLGRLNEELRNAKVSETRAMDLCSESKKRIEELEAEVEKEKQAESNMLESLVSEKTKELEAAKLQLEESRLQIASLHEQMAKLKNSSAVSTSQQNQSTGSLKSKPADQRSEIDVLKKELKDAIEGEEKSTKAMNDLALALKEVATQGNQTKEKLTATELALEHMKEAAEQLKGMVRSTEERYQKLLDEAKKEKELHKNTADRLRVEAEESHLAWNGKEMGFVDVIKKVEEEKAHTQHENIKLTESLKAAENASRIAKDENHKLRDILKQALNEANVAKEAATIAREENYQLKVSLADKEEALNFLTQENERLRINEAAANEKMKELKRLLAQAQSELRSEDKEECGTTFMSPEYIFDDHKDDNQKLEAAIKKGFSFNLHEIKMHSKYNDEDDMQVDEDPVKAEALKGSIFDPSTETPRSEPHTPKPPQGHHHRRRSSFTDFETANSEDMDHLDNAHHLDGSHHDSDGHFEDAEGDRHAHRRRKSIILKSFGYLLMRKSFSSHTSHTNHTSHTKKEPTTPTPGPAPAPALPPVPTPTTDHQ